MIGGILAFVALFLSFTNFELSGDVVGVTGLNMVQGQFDTFDDATYSFVGYLPLITAILGIIVIVTSIVSVVKKENEKTVSMVSLVIAVIALILMIVFAIQGTGDSLFSGDWKDLIIGLGTLGGTISLGIGTWIAIIGSVLAVIGAGLQLKDCMAAKQ